MADTPATPQETATDAPANAAGSSELHDAMTPADDSSSATDANAVAAPPDITADIPAPAASADATPSAATIVGHAPHLAGTSAAVPFAPPALGDGAAPSASDIDMLDDVELDVKVELGRAEMYIQDVLELGVGSVVELSKLAGDPVDVYVNDRLVARGEVLVLNDNFCVRVNDILSPVPELETSR